MVTFFMLYRGEIEAGQEIEGVGRDLEPVEIDCKPSREGVRPRCRSARTPRSPGTPFADGIELRSSTAPSSRGEILQAPACFLGAVRDNDPRPAVATRQRLAEHEITLNIDSEEAADQPQRPATSDRPLRLGPAHVATRPNTMRVMEYVEGRQRGRRPHPGQRVPATVHGSNKYGSDHNLCRAQELSSKLFDIQTARLQARPSTSPVRGSRCDQAPRELKKGGSSEINEKVLADP